MTCSSDFAHIQRIFNDDEPKRLRHGHPEGAVICTISHTVAVVLDQCINIVCSCCLKVSRMPKTLFRCSKCSFVKYCSTTCQAKDWKQNHKNECPILKIVRQVCSNQPTNFTRLFVRAYLQMITFAWKEMGEKRAKCPTPEWKDGKYAEEGLPYFDEEAEPHLRQLFKTWKPILIALDDYFDTNVRQFGNFMKGMADLKETAMEVYPTEFQYGQAPFEKPNSPIAYATFLNPDIASPSWERNVVMVPIIDTVKGPILQYKAVRALKAGEQLRFSNATNLLANPLTMKERLICTEQVAKGACVQIQAMLQSNPRFDFSRTIHEYFKERVHALCPVCRAEVSVGVLECEKPGTPGRMYHVAVACERCGFGDDQNTVGKMVLTDTTALTAAKYRQYTLMSKADLTRRLKDVKALLDKMEPMVAPFSFALGILYRELADIYEALGDMENCVAQYKKLIPIIEKYMDKYDQNIYDGLARLIVFHLERGEVAHVYPYIEKAWTRLQIVPGKESFDFHVVDKLRKAVVLPSSTFTFQNFCNKEPA